LVSKEKKSIFTYCLISPNNGQNITKMIVIAKLEVKNGKVVPVSNGVDHSTKETTFRLRILQDSRIKNADVIADTKAEAIAKLQEAKYVFVG
jgi:hypothetical protein